MSGLNAAAVMIPGRGAIFTAEPSTLAPNYKTLDPANPADGWTCLGHTSKENAVALSKSGGDATTFGSWWAEVLAVTYEANTWDFTVGALQIDSGVLDLAFNGTVDPVDGGYIVPAEITAVDKAVMILAVQGTKRMALYLPKVSITLGDAPTFDPAKLFEVPLKGTVLTEENVLMKWFHPALEVPTVPAIASAAPTGSAAAGATVTLTGADFIGVTAAKMGNTAATFNVVSNTEMTIVVPAGTAGAAAITLFKGADLVSAAFTYARA